MSLVFQDYVIEKLVAVYQVFFRANYNIFANDVTNVRPHQRLVRYHPQLAGHNTTKPCIDFLAKDSCIIIATWHEQSEKSWPIQ